MAKRNKATDDRGEFENALLGAVRSARWLLPESEEDVEKEERLFGKDSLELPESLRDPLSALQRPRHRRKPPASKPAQSGEVEESLARAAREGSSESISPEIEARMRRDRERAGSEEDG